MYKPQCIVLDRNQGFVTGGVCIGVDAAVAAIIAMPEGRERFGSRTVCLNGGRDSRELGAKLNTIFSHSISNFIFLTD